MTWTDAGIFFIYNIYINIYNIYINISLNQFVLKRLKDMVHRILQNLWFYPVTWYAVKICDPVSVETCLYIAFHWV